MAVQARARSPRPVRSCRHPLPSCDQRTARPATRAAEKGRHQFQCRGLIRMSSGAVERFDDKARESFEHVGQTTVYRGELLRQRVSTRRLHWTVALFFFLALFTGFALYLPWLFHWITPVFGGGQLTRTLHPYFGVAFVFFFAFQVLNWVQLMLWTAADSRWLRNIKKITTGEEKMDPPETGFFNAGQKLLFWEVVVGCVLYIITGTILWAGARTFGAGAPALIT